MLRSEISNLPEKIKVSIPEALQYACCYFVAHLAEGAIFNSTMLAELKTLLTNHIFHWIEAMGWLGKLHKADTSLKHLLEFLKVSNYDNQILGTI